MSRRWLALVGDRSSFVTSDNPVVTLRGSCWRPEYGLGTPGTIINFPVSPGRFLVLADEWERTFGHAEVNNKDVFVRRIAAGATRFIFAATRDDSIRTALPPSKGTIQAPISTYSVVDEGVGKAVPSPRRPSR